MLVFALLGLLLSLPSQLLAVGDPYVVKDIRPGGDAITPFPAYPNPFAALGDSIIFAANDGMNGTELWKSDGTASGTVLLKDINPGSGNSGPCYLTPLAGKIVFQAADVTHGGELWVTDGTPGGTQLLADIYPGAIGSNPKKFTRIDNTLYFEAATASGSKIWKTDGTPAGTMLISDITPTYFTSVDSLTASGSKLLVVTYLSGATPTWTLRNVDLLTGTTALIATTLAQPGTITPCNDKFFFRNNTAAGIELWLTDGTEGGTGMVKDIHASGSSSPIGLVCHGSTLYFSATEPATGSELWKSDGTQDGTVLVKNINPGTASSNPAKLVALNGRFLFAATEPGTGMELWSTDGTDSGTALLKEINPGSGNSSYAGYFTVAGNLAFFSADDGVHGGELWTTDGTADNTSFLADLNPGSSPSYPDNFTVAGNNLFFSAYDGSSRYKLMAVQITPAPASRITSPLTGSFSNAATLTISGEASSDTGSPINLVEVSTDNGISWSMASGTASWSYSWQPATDGEYSLLSRATDLAGGVETPGPAVQVTIDRLPPGGYMEINSNTATTATTAVTLSINATANDPGLTCEYFTPPFVCGTISIRFSNDGTSWSGWTTAQAMMNWTLPNSDGEKTVYAQLKDRAGNTINTSDSIILDTSQVPVSTITSPTDGFATNGSSVVVTGTAAPGPGGGTVTQVEVSRDGGSTWLTATGTTSWSINISLPSAGSYIIKSRARTSTLVETPAAGITVTVDRTPPSGTLALFYGDWTLNANANDGGICVLMYPNLCGYLEMSYDNIFWQTATIHPASGDPLWIRDRAGNSTFIPGGSYINPNGGPIYMTSAGAVYYSLLQHAYDAAQAGDLIKLKSALAGNLTLNRSTSLTIRGGYSNDFTTVSGTSPITGNLLVQAGSALVENIDLNGTMSVNGGDITVSGIALR